MKKFISKILGFAIILISLIFLIKQLTPANWGNEELSSKIDYYLEHEASYNTIFIGPSKMNRHVLPSIIDSMSIKNIQSFNLSSDALFFLESSYTVEKLLPKLKNTKNIIFYYSRPGAIFDANLHSTRSKYFLDYKRASIANRFFKTIRPEQKRIYFFSYLENLLGIGEFRQILSSIMHESLSPAYYAMDHGYQSMDDAYGAPQALAYVKRLKGKDLVGIDFSPSTEPVDKSKLTHHDQVMIDALEDLSESCSRYDINCIFLHDVNYPFHLNVPHLKNIYMGDGVDFPDYFKFNLHYNEGHLNHVGAIMYSKRLGGLMNESNYFRK